MGLHTVDSIQIEGFRGRPSPINLKFDENVNFIIGRNGTGKTSLINLINAALSSDVPSLKIASFKKIAIRLKASGSSRRPIITFAKFIQPDGVETLHFALQKRASDPIEFEEVEFNDDSWDLLYRASLFNSSRRSKTQILDRNNIKERISEFVKTTWLSVYRSPGLIEKQPERKFESPIDERMHHVFIKFGTFFSILDKESASKTDKFQTNYFLSLISPPKVDVFSGAASEIDPRQEREALREMFTEFGLARAVYSAKLESFIKNVERAVQWRMTQKDGGMPSDIFLTLTDALRIDTLVREWADLLEERSKIYSPKTEFINIINSLLYKKEIEINSGNQPLFRNDLGDMVNPDNLSSGEKQLLIILGEALIQRGQCYIFMADEPELSLHIDWQEKLVPSLRRINPSSQIIFATHSPDIVGAYGKNTIDLEQVLG